MSSSFAPNWQSIMPAEQKTSENCLQFLHETLQNIKALVIFKFFAKNRPYESDT